MTLPESPQPDLQPPTAATSTADRESLPTSPLSAIADRDGAAEPSQRAAAEEWETTLAFFQHPQIIFMLVFAFFLVVWDVVVKWLEGVPDEG